MNELYLSGIGFVDGIFLPLFYLLGLVTSFVTTDATTALSGLAIVISWILFLHNTDIFPAYLIATLDIFLFSGFVSLGMRLLRWIMDVLPFV